MVIFQRRVATFESGGGEISVKILENEQKFTRKKLN